MLADVVFTLPSNLSIWLVWFIPFATALIFLVVALRSLNYSGKAFDDDRKNEGDHAAGVFVICLILSISLLVYSGVVFWKIVDKTFA